MNDIHNIKNFVGYNYYFLYLFLIIIMLIIINFIMKKKSNKIIISQIDFREEKIDFFDLLSNLKTDYINASNQLFYTNFKSLIILYLEHKIKKPISKMTLKEIEKLELEKNSKELLRDVYFKQYSKNAFVDSLEYRNKLLVDFENMLKVDSNNDLKNINL